MDFFHKQFKKKMHYQRKVPICSYRLHNLYNPHEEVQLPKSFVHF